MLSVFCEQSLINRTCIAENTYVKNVLKNYDFPDKMVLFISPFQRLSLNDTM